MKGLSRSKGGGLKDEWPDGTGESEESDNRGSPAASVSGTLGGGMVPALLLALELPAFSELTGPPRACLDEVPDSTSFEGASDEECDRASDFPAD